MKQIQIFLASSIVEFRQERLALGNYLCWELGEMLRSVYDIRLRLEKCEDMDNALTLSGKQSAYNQVITESDLVVFLFGEKAGAYTLHELDVAVQAFGKRSSKILVFTRIDLSKAEDASLRTLRQKLNEYQLAPVSFTHPDTIRHGILFRLAENGLFKIDLLGNWRSAG